METNLTWASGFMGHDFYEESMRIIDNFAKESGRDDFERFSDYVELEQFVLASSQEIVRRARQLRDGLRRASEAESRPHSTRRLR